MNRTETLADIAARYPAIPASVAERHWRKSDAFLRMLNRKYAAHTDGGTLTQFVRDVCAEVADARLCRPRRTVERGRGYDECARAGARADERKDNWREWKMTQKEINDLLERPQPTCASAKGNRKDVLLRAAFDMLRRSIDSPYIIETCEIETHYDGADCDGFCLMEDIAAELGIENDAKPIPLEKQMEAVHELSDEAAKAGKEAK